MDSFLTIALIIATVIIIILVSRLATINSQESNNHSNVHQNDIDQKLAKENEKLLKEIEEFKNKYQALWNLKNKVVEENIEYRNQIRKLSERNTSPLSNVVCQTDNSQIDSLMQEIASLHQEVEDLTNKYHALRDLKDKLVEENSQYRSQIKQLPLSTQKHDEEIKRLKCALQSKQVELDDALQNLEFALSNQESIDVLISENKSLRQENLNVNRIKDTIRSMSYLPYAQIPDDFKESILSGRLANAFNSTDLFIDGNLCVSANISSGENIYKTSLFNCTCPDYINRHKPCKHMLFLSYTSGLLLLNKEALSDFAKFHIFKLNSIIKAENEEAAKAKAQNALLKQRNREMQKMTDRLQKELDQSYPWLAGMYKRFQIEQDNHDAYMLSNRSTTSKDIVKKLKKKNAQLKYEKALYENQLLVYESLFPWLEEFKKVDVDKAVKYVRDVQSDKEYDRISDYLSPAEYKTLSSAEKSQLALERYKKHRKSDWEIGIDYERYIGYRYETAGYKVSYTGAIDYLKDMGRDLICEKNDEVLIIQCKRWSVHKKIHEKHVFQLFGSTIHFKYKNPELTYKPILYTTTKLSDVASYCAEQLGVEIVESEKYVDYPCIKCNISKKGEKIYHLPFDQQYDRISIEAEKGEFYAMTASEAEEKGFRRAFRHRT